MQFYRCVYLPMGCDISGHMGATLYAITGSSLSFMSLRSRIYNIFASSKESSLGQNRCYLSTMSILLQIYFWLYVGAERTEIG